MGPRPLAGGRNSPLVGIQGNSAEETFATGLCAGSAAKLDAVAAHAQTRPANKGMDSNLDISASLLEESTSAQAFLPPRIEGTTACQALIESMTPAIRF